MIKKKLFTMAMAASMVLPTHLVAMSTLTTSVLADEFKDGIEVTELSQNDF